MQKLQNKRVTKFDCWNLLKIKGQQSCVTTEASRKLLIIGRANLTSVRANVAGKLWKMAAASHLGTLPQNKLFVKGDVSRVESGG